MSNSNTSQPVKYEFNTRFFFVTSVIALVVGGAAFGVHYLQTHRVEEALLARAQQFIAEDNPRKASESLFRYLRMVPAAHEQRVQLARQFDKAAARPSERVVELYEEAIPVTADAGEAAEMRTRVAELHYGFAATRGYRHFDDAIDYAWQVITSVAGTDEEGRSVEAKASQEDVNELANLVKENPSWMVPRNCSDHQKQAWKWLSLSLLGNYRVKEQTALTPPPGAVNVATALEIASEMLPADLACASQWAVVLKAESDWLTDRQLERWPDEAARDLQAQQLLQRLPALNEKPEDKAQAHLLYASFLQRTRPDDPLIDEQVQAELAAAIKAAPDMMEPEMAAGVYWLAKAIEAESDESDTEEAGESVPQSNETSGEPAPPESGSLPADSNAIPANTDDPSAADQAPPAENTKAWFLAKAQVHFEKALANSQKGAAPSPRPYYGLAEVALQRNEIASRRNDVAMQKKEAVAAAEAWKKGLEVDPSPNLEVTDNLIRVLKSLDDLDGAEVQLADLAKSLSAFTVRSDVNENALKQATRFVSLLRGELLVARGEFRKASEELQPLFDAYLADDAPSYTHRVALSLARAFMGQATYERAEPCLARAINALPEEPTARLLASLLQKQLGNNTQALDLLRRIAREEQRAIDWLRLARESLAVEAGKELAEQDYREIDAALDRAEQVLADRTVGEPWELDFLRINVARLRDLQAAGEAGLSRDETRDRLLLQFVATEEKYPENLELKKRLHGIYGALEAPAEQQRVYQWLTEFAPRWETLQFDAQKLIADKENKDYAAARQVYQQALELAIADPVATLDDRVALENRILQMFSLEGDFSAAVQFAVQLVEQRPQDRARVAERLFNLAYALDVVISDPEAMRLFDEWEGVTNSAARSFCEGRQVISQLETVTSFTQRRQLQEQLARHVQQMSVRRSGWAPTKYLEGMAAAVNGQSDAAANAFRSAIDLGDGRLSVYLRLLYSLRAANRIDEAKLVLTQVQQQIPRIQELTGFSVGLEARLGELNRAVELADARLEVDPSDPLAHLWKGELAVLRKDVAEAETEFVKAVELGAGDLRTWNGLIAFYLGENRRDQVEETIRKLEHAFENGQIKLSPEKQALALGQAYENLGGRQDQVRELYEEAVKQAPEDPEVLLRIAAFLYYRDPAAAEKYLGQIPPTSIYWPAARQILVRLLAERGRSNDWEEVGRLLADSSEGDVLADRRLEASLQISRSIRAESAAEQNEYLELAKLQMQQVLQQSFRPEESDLALMAVIHVGQSEIADSAQQRIELLDEALQYYRELCRRANPDPLQMAAAIEVLTARVQLGLEPSSGDDARIEIPAALEILIDEADGLIDRMEEQSELSAAAQALRIRWYRLQKQEDQVAPYLEACLAKRLKSASTDESRAEAHLAASQLYEAIDDADKSLEMAQRAYELDPRQFQGVAAAKVQSGHMSEMVDFLRGIYQNSPEDRLQVAGVLSAGLLSGKPSPADLANADSLLNEAMTEFPRNVGLWAAVSSVRVLQGRQEEAIALLEDALDWSPDAPVVLNNLATLLIESEKQEDRKRALVLIDRAIGGFGRNPALLDTRGMVLFGLERVDEAINNLTQASRQQEADARCHFHLAVTLLARAKSTGSSEDRSRAEEAYKRSLEMGLEDLLLTGQDRGFVQSLNNEFPGAAPSAG